MNGDKEGDARWDPVMSRSWNPSPPPASAWKTDFDAALAALPRSPTDVHEQQAPSASTLSSQISEYQLARHSGLAAPRPLPRAADVFDLEPVAARPRSALAMPTRPLSGSEPIDFDAVFGNMHAPPAPQSLQGGQHLALAATYNHGSQMWDPRAARASIGAERAGFVPFDNSGCRVSAPLLSTLPYEQCPFDTVPKDGCGAGATLNHEWMPSHAGKRFSEPAQSSLVCLPERPALPVITGASSGLLSSRSLSHERTPPLSITGAKRKDSNKSLTEESLSPRKSSKMSKIGGEAETLLEKQRARRRESARRSRQKKKSTMQSLQDDLTRLHDEVQQLKEKDHVLLALLQESTAPADLAALLARRDAALRARAAARPYSNAEGLDHSAPSDGGGGEDVASYLGQPPPEPIDINEMGPLPFDALHEELQSIHPLSDVPRQMWNFFTESSP